MLWIKSLKWPEPKLTGKKILFHVENEFKKEKKYPVICQNHRLSSFFYVKLLIVFSKLFVRRRMKISDKIGCFLFCGVLEKQFTMKCIYLKMLHLVWNSKLYMKLAIQWPYAFFFSSDRRSLWIGCFFLNVVSQPWNSVNLPAIETQILWINSVTGVSQTLMCTQPSWGSDWNVDGDCPGLA